MAQKVRGVPASQGAGKRRGAPPPRPGKLGAKKRPGELSSVAAAAAAAAVDEEAVSAVLEAAEDPAPDMSWKKADLLEHALGAGLDVSDSNTKAQILAAIEA